MSNKTLLKVIFGAIVISLDIVVSNIFDSFMLLFNSKSAVKALANDDTSYMLSQTLLINPLLFYVILVVINIIIFSLLLGIKRNKKKIESSEDIK